MERKRECELEDLRICYIFGTRWFSEVAVSSFTASLPSSHVIQPWNQNKEPPLAMGQINRPRSRSYPCFARALRSKSDICPPRLEMTSKGTRCNGATWFLVWPSLGNEWVRVWMRSSKHLKQSPRCAKIRETNAGTDAEKQAEPVSPYLDVSTRAS
jgi:hypothetical protein